MQNVNPGQIRQVQASDIGELRASAVDHVQAAHIGTLRTGSVGRNRLQQQAVDIQHPP